MLPVLEAQREQPHRARLVGDRSPNAPAAGRRTAAPARRPAGRSRARSRPWPPRSALASVAKARGSSRNMLRGSWSSRTISASADRGPHAPAVERPGPRPRSQVSRNRSRQVASSASPPAYQPSGPTSSSQKAEQLLRLGVHAAHPCNFPHHSPAAAKRKAARSPDGPLAPSTAPRLAAAAARLRHALRRLERDGRGLRQHRRVGLRCPPPPAPPAGSCDSRHRAAISASSPPTKPKNASAPNVVISQPISSGPEIAPRPLMNSSPPEAAAMSAGCEEVVGVGDQQRIERVRHRPEHEADRDHHRRRRRRRRCRRSRRPRRSAVSAMISTRRSIRSDSQPIGNSAQQPAGVDARHEQRDLVHATAPSRCRRPRPSRRCPRTRPPSRNVPTQPSGEMRNSWRSVMRLAAW